MQCIWAFHLTMNRSYTPIRQSAQRGSPAIARPSARDAHGRLHLWDLVEPYEMIAVRLQRGDKRLGCLEGAVVGADRRVVGAIVHQDDPAADPLDLLNQCGRAALGRVAAPPKFPIERRDIPVDR